MSAGFDDDKRDVQLLLTIQRQDASQFAVHGALRRRQDAQVDYARPLALDENQSTEVAISRHESSLLLVSDAEQLGIIRLREPKLRHRNDVVAQTPYELNRDRVHILVGEESHGVVATWMSSAANTSMAYWMQARMSSGFKSG